LICDGEGTAESLGLPEDGQIGTADMADYCVRAEKPLLVGLDASYSTIFAEKTIEELARRRVLDRVDVGFLTSGRGRCFNSAVVISSENRESLAPGGGFGWKVYSSMFSRALLFELAYRLAGKVWGSLADLPGRINVPGREMQNGFEAAFQCTRPDLGRQPITLFFPWSPIAAGEMSWLNPDVQFTDVIPNEELGALFDDIGNVWATPGDGAESGFFFCDISISSNDVSVRRKGELSGSVPGHAAVIERLRVQDKALRNTGGVVRVPLEPIADRVRAMLRAHPGRGLSFLCLEDDYCPWYSELVQFVEALNGRVSMGQRRQLHDICLGCGDIGQNELHDMIVEARKQAAAQLNIDLDGT
jgi:hypothetical protein